MTFEKAIEILTQRGKDFRPGFDPDERDATKLGKEALEFLKRWRDKAEIQPYPLLPSETVG